jgi:hypothetical protein
VDEDDVMARRDAKVIRGQISEKLVQGFRVRTGWDMRAPVDEARARELSKKYASRNE